MFELECRYDGRKSFYGKAKVDEPESGVLKLYSYGTHVATIRDGKPVKEDEYWASMTTNRHIREFYKQFATEE